jgi:hypothetical protein
MRSVHRLSGRGRNKPDRMFRSIRASPWPITLKEP